jgi:hypothetical protein
MFFFPALCPPHRTHLQHLDKCNTQIQVGLVTADQTQAEKDTNRDNRSQVYAPRHGHLFPGVEDGGEASEELRHDGSK